MTDDGAFQSHLDAHPDDHTARLVFADWLQDRGDPRAEGMRALARFFREASLQVRSRAGCMIAARDIAKWRRDPKRVYGWCYWTGRAAMRPGDSQGWRNLHDELPRDWFDLIDGERRHGQIVFKTRREAEDAAALAFAALPAARRAELLATEVLT